MNADLLEPSRVDAAARAWGAALLHIAGADPRMRREAGRDETWMVVTGSPAPSVNGVFCLARVPAPDQVELLADRAARTAAQYAGPVSWSVQVRSHPTEAIVRTAATHGLTAQSWEPFMVRDLEAAPQSAPSDSPLRMRAVDGSEADLYAATLGACFQAPKEIFTPLFTAAVLDAPGITAYLGEIDGIPVATGMGILLDGHIGVFNISTAAAHRKRGYGALITEHVVRQGHHQGARTAYLRASDMAVSMYASLGFTLAEHWTYLTAP
ncbi:MULTISPECIES: GNAT family N-acetyltransferase [unclassified Streptomyces]|uniref:GNAT family N-acetyltransferase n=1 Tax=unclassified Streptomyces TaxID=2593676 RepID=UPI0033F54F35